MNCRFILAVACINICFLVLLTSIPVHDCGTVCFSDKGHLGCVQFEEIMNKGAVNIHIKKCIFLTSQITENKSLYSKLLQNLFILSNVRYYCQLLQSFSRVFVFHSILLRENNAKLILFNQ